MNVNTGAVYDSYDNAMWAGEDPKDIVEVFGTDGQIADLATTIRSKANRKSRNRAASKRARKSRRENR